MPLLEESGLAAGRDFNVAFSPERVDPGRTDYTLRNTPKIVGGLTPACLERARRAVRAGLRPRSCRSRAPRRPSCRSCSRTSSARSTSRSSTSWRCCATGWASTSGRSSTPPPPSPTASCASSPAPGWAATACRSTRSTWPGRRASTDMPTEFIELAGEVNQRMPDFCVEQIARALNDHCEGRSAARGSRSSASPTSRASATCASRPALKIMRAAARARRGAGLPRRLRAELPDYEPVHEPLDDALEGADCAVIVTAHPGARRRGGGGRRAARASTFAASRAGSRRRTWCACEQRAPVRVGRRRPRLLGPEPGAQLRPPAGLPS